MDFFVCSQAKSFCQDNCMSPDNTWPIGNVVLVVFYLFQGVWFSFLWGSFASVCVKAVTNVLWRRDATLKQKGSTRLTVFAKASTHTL